MDWLLYYIWWYFWSLLNWICGNIQERNESISWTHPCDIWYSHLYHNLQLDSIYEISECNWIIIHLFLTVQYFLCCRLSMRKIISVYRLLNQKGLIMCHLERNRLCQSFRSMISYPVNLWNHQNSLNHSLSAKYYRFKIEH